MTTAVNAWNSHMRCNTLFPWDYIYYLDKHPLIPFHRRIGCRSRNHFISSTYAATLLLENGIFPFREGTSYLSLSPYGL